MTVSSFGDDEELNEMDKKLEKDILQAIEKSAGISITAERLNAMDIGDVEKLVGITAKDPRGEGLYEYISPGARRWNRDFVTAILGKFVSSKEYQEREK